MRLSYGSGVHLAVWCLVCGLVANAWPARGAAQESGSLQEQDAAQDGAPPGYRAVIDQALSEYQAHHYPEARALFLEAHGLWPTARTARALGMAAYELRDYPECILYLEKALGSTVRPLDPELRDKTQALLTRAYRLVARVNVALSPASAQATVDGKPATLTADKPLVLAPGTHELTFSAPGHASQKRALHVNGGELEHWRIVLAPGSDVPSPREVAARAEADAPTREASAQHASRRKRPVYKNPWLWTGVGAAVVASAVAVAVGVTAARDPRVKTDPITPTAFMPSGGATEVP